VRAPEILRAIPSPSPAATRAHASAPESSPAVGLGNVGGSSKRSGGRRRGEWEAMTILLALESWNAQDTARCTCVSSGAAGPRYLAQSARSRRGVGFPGSRRDDARWGW
jgi:hypothetical protein